MKSLSLVGGTFALALIVAATVASTIRDGLVAITSTLA